jgi:hypothetical protein
MSQTARSTSSIREGPGVSSGGRVVPWLTVLPLAVVLAFGDGFWATSLRGAVGAIERTQGPFASWLRESTMVLPVFVLAVLGALTLALRWFGPVLRPRAFAATALMVVAAGTLAGIAEVAASSAYDYHLQSDTLAMMESMRHASTASLLAQQQQASLGLQVHAVAYGAGIILVTNLVLVALVVAFRGGRLDVSSTRPAGKAPRSRVQSLRLLLAAGLVGSAVIHAAVVPQHLSEWGAAGVFFMVLAAAELAGAALLAVRPRPGVLLVAVVVSIAPLALWLYSRTLGLPFGPGAGAPEPVGLADLAACALEAGTLIIAVILVRGSRWSRRPPAPAHLRALALVVVIAVTSIGLAGSAGNATWFGDLGLPADHVLTTSR